MVRHQQVDDSAGDDRQGGPPMTYQRPWTSADDATVRLRRCREPLPHTERLYQNVVSRTIEPLELEIAQELPDVCSRHGRPAVARKPIRVCFYDAKQHPRFHRIAVANWPTKQLSPLSTILVGDWPVCDRCAGAARRARRIAAVIAAVMTVNLLVLAFLIVAARAGLMTDFQAAVRPLAWMLFPGSIPIEICVLVLLLHSGTEPAVFRPIYDERFAFVRAHPHFRKSLQAMPNGRPPTAPTDH
ncbi:hypothetical protein ABZ942_15775 [Nocardia sp. NPDC046473]|uniref:hypothetical protein n=1 Tax=Nocardia sp. NPDC046473 TaxID=3155733 RepID=UPI0033D39AF9